MGDGTIPRDVRDVKQAFEVLANGIHLQTATMLLEPGEASGEKGNEHAQSEQVLFVVEGEVHAEIGDRKMRIGPGESVIVPKGAPHAFRNAGERRAVTFNVYAPPAY